MQHAGKIGKHGRLSQGNCCQITGKAFSLARVNRSNLLQDLPTALPDEVMQDLVCRDGVRIERIVSHGQASAPDDWYDQDENEWVLLLAGAARLQIDDEGERTLVILKPGDHYLLPAHLKHRVDWTTPHEPTVWLAVWWGGGD